MYIYVSLLTAFVTDYLCEPSQQAGPSYEELSQQLCGDLHRHSSPTPASPHTLLPSMCAAKCQFAHICK